MLGIILDHLLENEEKIERLNDSLDIRHINDPPADDYVDSDDAQNKFIDDSHIRLWMETKQTFPKSRKRTQNDLIENESATKKTKTAECVPRELTPTRKSISSCPETPDDSLKEPTAETADGHSSPNSTSDVLTELYNSFVEMT